MIFANENEFWLKVQSKSNPNKISLITPRLRKTFKDLYNECNHISTYLKNIGIGKNDYVGILYGHSYEFFIIVNAIWRNGAIPVLLSTREKNDVIIRQLNKVNANHLLIDEKLISKYSELIFDKTSYINYHEVGFASDSKTETKINEPDFNISDNAIILFSSGSSGEPKAVVHTFESLYESVKIMDSFFNLSDHDIWLASLPFYHIGGLMILIRSLLTGSSVVFPDSLGFDDVINAFVKNEPTHASIVLTTLKRILDENISLGKNVKYIFLGGGPLEANLCTYAINKGLPIVKVYGSTETCSMITALPTNEFPARPYSAGLPLDMSKIKIKIMNKDKDGIGEIYVQSPTLFKEYKNDQQLTNDKYIDGYYNTGDYGRVDNDGYLFVESRRNDIIITGGENVSIKEIENVFSTINEIKEFYIFPLEDDKWGQSINAVVVKDIPHITEENITEILKGKLANYKIPKRIYFLQEVPKTELGKVNRNELFKHLKLNNL